MKLRSGHRPSLIVHASYTASGADDVHEVRAALMSSSFADSAYRAAGGRPPGCCSHPLIDVGLPAGVVEQRTRIWPAGHVASLHHTHTVDVGVVMAGTVNLVLRDQIIPLAQGDTVLLDGIVHGWQVGPDGCALAMNLFAVPESTGVVG